MTQNRDRKDKIRARMAATGEPYTAAARHIDGAGPSPAELAGRGVAAARARAEAYSADDPGHEAFRARRELAGVEEWERRRAGRPVRLWAAVIEIRTSALDEDDAWVRLGIYLRHPWHRPGASPLLYGTWPWRLTGSKPARPGIRDCLDQLDPAQLSAAARRRLELGCGQGKHRTRHEWNHDLVVTVLAGLALRAVRVGRRRARRWSAGPAGLRLPGGGVRPSLGERQPGGHAR